MELGQCLFLVLGMVCPGASPPPSTAGALSTREGGWGPGGGASRAWGLPLSWVKTASQVRLTFPRGTRASHPSPVPAQHGAGPRGRRPAPRGCPALARSPLGVSPRAGSPDSMYKGRAGAHQLPETLQLSCPWATPPHIMAFPCSRATTKLLPTAGRASRGGMGVALPTASPSFASPSLALWVFSVVVVLFYLTFGHTLQQVGS